MLCRVQGVGLRKLQDRIQREGMQFGFLGLGFWVQGLALAAQGTKPGNLQCFQQGRLGFMGCVFG